LFIPSNAFGLFPGGHILLASGVDIQHPAVEFVIHELGADFVSESLRLQRGRRFMWDFIWQIFGALGGAAFFIGIAAWITKTIISRQLSLELERYKNELKDKADRELERVRTEGKMRALEHEVRFRKLHEKVAESVATVFLAMSKLHSSLSEFAFCLENEPERRPEAGKRLTQATQEFKVAYGDHRLFLPTAIYQQIKKFDDLVFNASMGCVHAAACDKIWRDGGGDKLKAEQSWIKAKDLMANQIAPLLEKIQSGFQELLGCPNFETSPV
jgi:hypothetical protein